MSKPELEQQVEKLISEFDEYFQKEMGNEPIVKSELAILKTFCWYIVRARGTNVLPGVVVPVEEKTDAKAGVRDEVQPVRESGDAGSGAVGPQPGT